MSQNDTGVTNIVIKIITTNILEKIKNKRLKKKQWVKKIKK